MKRAIKLSVYEKTMMHRGKWLNGMSRHLAPAYIRSDAVLHRRHGRRVETVAA
jgi:hypothetical protein